MKRVLLENEHAVRERLTTMITQRLHNYPQAEALAKILLAESTAFSTAVASFITETYDRLILSGFPKQDSWNLVSKLIHRIFAVDCFFHRGTVGESLDVKKDGSTRSTAVGILWGTLATHQVMREYMRHGIENHPSISSEYVRFLVANCGLSRLQKLETTTLQLQSDLKSNMAEMKKTMESVKKMAASASNKADQVEKAVKKK
mmetsp:Transcript_13572/g.15820  ORF Transcript_13572/g.15820 Transcript_13572/m.15820 type:complete len:203 (-) Transcript_13572:164-772(-)